VVALFGGIGAVLRGLLGNFKGYLPWGILIANTVSSVVAGWAILTDQRLDLVLVAGLAGGLSTFSTCVGQTWQLMVEERRLAALLNVGLNLILPFTGIAIVTLCL
jgi:CrcB protein